MNFVWEITYLTAFRIDFCFFLESNLFRLVYWVNDSPILKLINKGWQLLSRLSVSLFCAQFDLFQNTLPHLSVAASWSFQVQTPHSYVLKWAIGFYSELSFLISFDSDSDVFYHLQENSCT